MDPAYDAYIADVLETATRRAIATILGGHEEYVGGKDKRISDMVKDDLNRAKRIIYSKLTRSEIESAHE